MNYNTSEALFQEDFEDFLKIYLSVIMYIRLCQPCNLENHKIICHA